MDIPLEQVIFCVVDVETTGLHVRRGDRICEIAMARFREGRILEEYGTLVNPERPISPGASAVNRITDEMISGAPPFARILPEVLRFLDHTVFVAHNAGFDFSFVRAECLKAGRAPRVEAVLDTLAVSRKFFSFQSHSLSALARELGISSSPEHRAMADVRATCALIARLILEARKRGCRTLQALLALQGSASPHPRLSPMGGEEKGEGAQDT
jgi:DNA polymerase-3 subunit epsilon